MSGPPRPAPFLGRIHKGWLLFALLTMLTAALIVPPLVNLSRYQRRISNSISRSIGRPVEMSSVKLMLLPRPGLAMNGFVVEEDPAFGSEPTLRSPSVVAYLRLMSLWRGHFEVSRISLDEPSLNLVHGPGGRWNIGSLLVQATHTPNVPASPQRPGSTSRFPYVEASNGRVNFKEGMEKSPFSLFNADFSMWLNGPDEWRIRIEAQPVRTDLDLDLSDTGLLRVQGSLKRAAELGEMPLHLTASWSNAPLGQVGRLLLGRDLGWRGNLSTDTDVTGDAHALSVKSRLGITGLHRQEFTPPEMLDLDPTCNFVYRREEQAVDGLNCTLPVKDGALTLHGGIDHLNRPEPRLTFGMAHLPASFILTALRTIHRGFAPGVEARGTADGNFVFTSAATTPVTTLLTGSATVTDLTLESSALKRPLAVGTLHLVAGSALSPRPRLHRNSLPSPKSPSLELVPLTLAGDGLTLSGRLTRSGFELHAKGAPSLSQLTALTKSFGLLHSSIAALGPQGTSALDLTMRGPWTSMAGGAPGPIDIAGTLRLQNAVYNPAFLAGPVSILSAQATYSPTEVVWSPITASFDQIPLTVSLAVPKNCIGTDCSIRFNAGAPALDTLALERALTGSNQEALLGQILTRIDATLNSGERSWPAVSGLVHLNALMLGPLTLHGVTAAVALQGRKLDIETLDGSTLNGSLHASGTLAMKTDSPAYALRFVLTRAAAADAAALFHENWGSGEVTASGNLKMSGYTRTDLASSAKGSFHAEWEQGSSTALGTFNDWSGEGTITAKNLILQHAFITRGTKTEPVSGMIGFDRSFDLMVGVAPGVHLIRSLAVDR